MKTSILIPVALAAVCGCGGKQAETREAATPTPPAGPAESAREAQPVLEEQPGEIEEKPLAPVTEKLSEESLPGEIYITFAVKDFGTIKVRLFPEDAPKNVANIVNLAVEGFYDGLTFHRILPGFVVQGGDPEGTGAGGPGYTVTAEIERKHEKGCMAMARKPDQVNPKKESSGSQFYFCLEALTQLDGEYTVIGQITEGMDVLEKLGEVKTGKKDRPLKPPVIESVAVTAR